MNRAVIALGSNIEPKIHIAEARKLLAHHYRVLGESSFAITKPVGARLQADFINGAVLLETDLSMEQLKDALKQIEEGLGRDRDSGPNAPRTIDLDIVVWNGRIIDQDFYRRDYLKRSVLALIPDLPH